VSGINPPAEWNVVSAGSYEEWLAARERYLTASDVSAVLGVNPYKSRARVVAAKREALAGAAVERRAFSAMEAGQFCEEGVVRWFIHDRAKEALSIGEDAPVGGVMRNAFGTSVLVAHPDPAIRLAASPDALVVYGDGMRHLVEVKLLGPGSHDGEVPGSWQKWTHPSRSRAWAAMGREPALGCPVPHYTQLQVQLLCTGERFGWVVGACGTKRTDHAFARDEALHEHIIKATNEFWAEVEA
jgi:hypothetical protein